MSQYSEKREHSAILAVTIGSILEWYEIYLYIYWSPIIAKLFFDHESDILNLINTFLVFAVGFLARPLGGVFFGRIGDLIGRRKSLLLSIIMMIVPTLVMSVLPTYSKIGIFAPLILVFLRFFQALPAGGELPGAFCYLYESSAPIHRRYMTSWGAVGNQIGIIVSMLECYFLEKFLTYDQLVTWGWRLSFLVGGLIGFFGFYLRNNLQETVLYKDMAQHHRVTRQPIHKIFIEYKNKIGLGISFCALNSVGFYLISVLFPVVFSKLLGISYGNTLIISISMLVLTTIPLPFLGMLGDRWNNKLMLIVSTVFIIILIYPLYLSLMHNALVLSCIIAAIFILFFTCLSALIPYRFADLFPTPIRFTCVGLSYNIVDGIIGGFSPALALFLFSHTGNQVHFYWILLASALISLFAFFRIKEQHPPIA